uniref:SSD domain-containing protein n=1 Tax=Aplanochytrium stocchinoi TaxID=215587 RepID=A0A7S3PQM2_9STRA|mmetsp:Transcript_5383/g.7030  ORF Transcript_5383/g.7030 Transcript_5383/m.7030 type:complete len:941 (+) Transcript_5383:229-3051(+)
MLKDGAIDQSEEEGCVGSLKRRYLESMHKRTKTHCGGCFAIVLLLSFTVSAAYEFLQGDADFADPNQPATLAFDAVELSRELFDIAAEESEEESNHFEGVSFGYEWKDGRSENIFTPKNLQTICTIEQIMFAQSAYGFDLCDPRNINTTQTCVTSFTEEGVDTSIAGNFYRFENASFNFEDCHLLADEVVGNYSDLIYTSLSLSDSSPARFFVNSKTKSTITRSTLLLSHPVEKTAEEKLLDMEQDYFDFFGMEATLFRSVYRNPATLGDIKMSFFNIVLLENEFERMLPSDFIMAFGSMTFVAVWMGIYTKSLFLTVCCTGYILFSIPVSLFMYKVVFRILYFDFIHVLVIFIILGIGADGTFVVIDAYKQSRLLLDDDLERLVYSWSRSTATVFNTSFTTVVAFVVTGFTPLIPLSTFGIFAALCITVNFVFVCTIVPSTVILWERWFVKDKEKGVEKSEVVPELKKENSNSSFEGHFKSKDEAKHTLDALVEGNNRVFEHYYVPAILKCKQVFVLLGLVIGILGVYGVTKVSQLTKPEQWFPEDHTQSIFIEKLILEFLSGEEGEYAEVTVFWGIDKVERDYPARYSGDTETYDDKVIFDDSFDITDFQTQLAIIKMCELLENRTCDEDTCGGFTTLLFPETNTYQGMCTMREFHNWWNVEKNFSVPLNSANETLFYERLGLFVVENPEMARHVGIIGGVVKFFSIEYIMTLKILAPGSEVQNYVDIMDNIIEKYKSFAPASAQSVDYSSPDFVEYALELSLQETVIKGLAITFPIVFVVLLLATGNWILAAFSVIAIAFIVVTVMGFVFAALGWELGIAESIVSIMIVGLSVDYAIHLGHMYTVAGKSEGFESREDKFHYAVLTMGPTVLAGGMTTLGAGAFLFGAQITFFGKMGVLLVLTVTCSLFYSLVFLMSVAAWFGPQGTYANLNRTCSKQ